MSVATAVADEVHNPCEIPLSRHLAEIGDWHRLGLVRAAEAGWNSVGGARCARNRRCAHGRFCRPGVANAGADTADAPVQSTDVLGRQRDGVFHDRLLLGGASLVSQFFQLGLGYSPLDTGWRLLPWTATPLSWSARWGSARPHRPTIARRRACDSAAFRAYLTRAEALGFDSTWTQEQVLGSTPILGPIETMACGGLYRALAHQPRGVRYSITQPGPPGAEHQLAGPAESCADRSGPGLVGAR